MGGAVSVALVFFLASCAALHPAPSGTVEDRPIPAPVRHSIVFLVHGDGDYLFHDRSGVAHQADREEVAAARRVAERNPEAEVFIFHQQRRRHALFLFPRPDGRFYHYRGGRLVAETKYRRGRGSRHFSAEEELYTRFRSEEPALESTVFLYSGHELPEFDGRGYDRSMRTRMFTVDDLAGALPRFSYSDREIDLVVLSTCYGGTPYTIAKIAPFARTIMASPDNLHLSYFDLSPLEYLESHAGRGTVAELASTLAHHAFELLSEEVLTAVTVAVYDTRLVEEYVSSALPLYQQASGRLETLQPATPQHVDCATEPSYVLPTISAGVEILYRPPHFGRSKHVATHSGWECWTLPD